jgi:hypothetical protein
VQVQRGDEGVEKPDGIFRRDVILQRFREEQPLVTAAPSDVVPACRRPPASIKVSTVTVFSHSLSLEPTGVGAVSSTARSTSRVAGGSVLSR